MAKPRTIKLTTKDLGTYKFDTSKYVMLSAPLRREATTGRLVLSKGTASKQHR